MDRSGQGSCLRGPRGKFAGPVPESHFFKLIFLDSLHYMFGQLFPTYQSGAKRKCVIIVILRQGSGVAEWARGVDWRPDDQ